MCVTVNVREILTDPDEFKVDLTEDFGLSEAVAESLLDARINFVAVSRCLFSFVQIH